MHIWVDVTIVWPPFGSQPTFNAVTISATESESDNLALCTCILVPVITVTHGQTSFTKASLQCCNQPANLAAHSMTRYTYMLWAKVTRT